MNPKRVMLLAAAVLLASCTHGPRPVRPEPPTIQTITAEQLYANPDAYDRKTITVSGYLTPTWLFEESATPCDYKSKRRRAIVKYGFAKDKFRHAANHFVVLRGKFTKRDTAEIGEGQVVIQFGPDDVLGVIDQIRLVDVDRSRRCA
jgi:hypothetical protein